MKIEKLTAELIDKILNSIESQSEWCIYYCLKEFKIKINELIDAFNQFDKEQDLLIDCIKSSKKEEKKASQLWEKNIIKETQKNIISTMNEHILSEKEEKKELEMCLCCMSKKEEKVEKYYTHNCLIHPNFPCNCLTTQKKPEILPCPWCKKIPEFCEDSEGDYQLICETRDGICPVMPSTISFSTKQQAIDAWNKRV